jgi:predicted transcriptional regulator
MKNFNNNEIINKNKMKSTSNQKVENKFSKDKITVKKEVSCSPLVPKSQYVRTD